MSKFCLRYEFGKIILILQRIFGLIDRSTLRLKRAELKGRFILKHSYRRGDVLSPHGIGISVDLKGFNSLAEVGRNLIDTLKKTDIPFEVFDTEKTRLAPGNPDLSKPYADLCRPHLHYRTKILCTVAECYKEPEYRNFITPFWEFESGIEWARPNVFEGCAGLITFSDFCYHYFKKVAPKGMPVYKVRYPFVPHWELIKSAAEVRTERHIDPTDYVVFFHFDYGSCYERKNPEAVLKAFALSLKDKKAVLVIKTNGFECNQKKVHRLRDVAEELGIHHQTHFINEHLSKDELMSLINTADVYMSLHRGEGMGLGMLEAMALGKPVIATNFGGNTEFMNKDNSLLVDYTWMRPEKLDYKAYQKVEKWADADVHQAATYLKELYADPDKGRALGQKAKAFVESYFNVKDFAQDMKKILEEMV